MNDPDMEADRRENRRQAKLLPALLHREMVKIINLSEDGARLLVHNLTSLKPRMPLILEIEEDQYASVMCEPRWNEEIGKNLYVVGVAFTEGEIFQIRRILEKWKAHQKEE